jgi:hypothetical protein
MPYNCGEILSLDNSLLFRHNILANATALTESDDFTRQEPRLFQFYSMFNVVKTFFPFELVKLIIPRRCGQNTPLMVVCYQFILEPIREGNYTGSFIKAVFKVSEQVEFRCGGVLTMDSSSHFALISTAISQRSRV